AVDNYVVSTNGYATDTQAVGGTYVENTLAGTLQITESGNHIFTLQSVNSGKFFYFRRMIVEKIGDTRPDILEVFDADGNKTEDAKPGTVTVKANFFEEHEGVAATLYVATYAGGALTKATAVNRTTEESVETAIAVEQGETVKAFLWNAVTFAPICREITMRPVNTDPFAGDDEINAVFLGGSITFGSGTSNFANSYASKTGEWLKETYGADKVNCYNEGVPGTPSNYGLLRLERDVLSHNPDIVFVEFAVNDGGRDSRSDLECIVRMLQDCPTNPYIVFLYATNNTYTTPLYGFEEIAAYYDIPAINLKDALYSELSGKDPKAEGYFGDAVHPTDLGHAFYAEVITESLKTGRYYRKSAVKNGTLMAGSGAVSTTFLPLSDNSVDVLGTWVPGIISPSWSHDTDITYMKSSMVGDKLSFSFTGSILGIEHGYNKNAMKYEVWVDGTKRMTVDPYYNTESNQLICDASNITFALSEGTHDVEIITVDNEQGGNSELTLYSVVYGSYVN
ncbi:MAG: SGNH/GDSL hydrolase family protein, partial [Clostridia bacterium]|nr:SGNH/GDSL hydrolase family protein [Clostridia bacterium]